MIFCSATDQNIGGFSKKTTSTIIFSRHVTCIFKSEEYKNSITYTTLIVGWCKSKVKMLSLGSRLRFQIGFNDQVRLFFVHCHRGMFIKKYPCRWCCQYFRPPSEEYTRRAKHKDRGTTFSGVTFLAGDNKKDPFHGKQKRSHAIRNLLTECDSQSTKI